MPESPEQPSPESLLPAEIYAKYEAASGMIGKLCRPNEPGGRRWEMSIPARRDHDPDLVIWDGLRALRDGLVQALAREQRLVAELERVGGYLLTARAECQPEWLAGIAELIEKADAAIAASKEARAR